MLMRASSERLMLAPYRAGPRGQGIPPCTPGWVEQDLGCFRGVAGGPHLRRGDIGSAPAGTQTAEGPGHSSALPWRHPGMGSVCIPPAPEQPPGAGAPCRHLYIYTRWWGPPAVPWGLGAVGRRGAERGTGVQWGSAAPSLWVRMWDHG